MLPFAGGCAWMERLSRLGGKTMKEQGKRNRETDDTVDGRISG